MIDHGTHYQTQDNPRRTDTAPLWQVIGADPEHGAQQVRALASFGIMARCGLRAAPAGLALPGPHSPVLAEVRSRALVTRLLAQIPQRRAPVVFCGVHGAQARTRLLLAGADDAVSPRVAPCELAARLSAAAQRRAHMHGLLALAGFAFDTGLRQASWHGRALPVMPREFDLLLELARHNGAPVSRGALLQSVWQTAFDPGTNSVEVHICKLRRHLERLGPQVRIETVKGQGYRLVTPRASQG